MKITPHVSITISYLICSNDVVQLLALCVVKAMSFGGNLASYLGGVSLNNSVALQTKWTLSITYRGFNIIELDLSHCSPSNYQHFDTDGFASQSNAMANYISGLLKSTVLVGVMVDEPQYNLNTAAMNALLLQILDLTLK